MAEVLTALTFHLQSFTKPWTVDSFVELLLSVIQKTPEHEMKTQICAVCIIRNFEVVGETGSRWLLKCILGLFWGANFPPF